MTDLVLITKKKALVVNAWNPGIGCEELELLNALRTSVRNRRRTRANVTRIFLEKW